MTLEQLSNLSDGELAALGATKIHGWKLDKSGRYWLMDGNESESQTQPVRYYRPATDRNQSRDLLAAMVGRGAEFETRWSKKQPRILYRTGKVTPERIWDGTSPGVSARSETIAALLAAFAMEDKSNA